MSFTWPLALIALAAVPVLVALYIDRDRRRVASQAEFGNPDLLPNVVDREPGRLRYLPPLIMLVALVFLIVGVARPHATVSVPREEATIVLAMDVSRSMKATDVEPTRLDAAQDGREDLPRRGAGEVPRRRRLVRDARGCRRRADGGPRARRHGARHARARRGNAIGDAVALSLRVGQPQRGGEQEEAPRLRRARSSSSPTARGTAARSSRPRRRSRRSGAASPSTRCSSARRTASSRSS